MSQETELVEVDLECLACARRSIWHLPGDANARETVDALFCPGCHRRGKLVMVPSLERRT